MATENRADGAAGSRLPATSQSGLAHPSIVRAHERSARGPSVFREPLIPRPSHLISLRPNELDPAQWPLMCGQRNADRLLTSTAGEEEDMAERQTVRRIRRRRRQGRSLSTGADALVGDGLQQVRRRRARTRVARTIARSQARPAAAATRRRRKRATTAARAKVARGVARRRTRRAAVRGARRTARTVRRAARRSRARSTARRRGAVARVGVARRAAVRRGVAARSAARRKVARTRRKR
jgi:hypothetical protein